ncbi:hypothetical protein [Catellatospora citrea]|uniref:Uncharacterized protein n=1 Tax=Catellatospora citrea TaxID=53366 RepID=A0A8J3NY72_9ACTN|nr:hypothetical protein [Catellatospora citrea]GIF96733.1 hypothetical protein Cci01nite_18270 [Catellatospora citrea]
MVGALVAASLLGAPAVAAERLGGLQVYPGAGPDTASIHVRTSRGCPGTADAYYVKATGHGFPAGGQVVTASTGAGLSHTGPFDAYLALTMMDFAADNHTALQGTYTFTLYCIEAFSQQSFGEFTGSVKFTAPTRYEAVGAARPPSASPSPPAPAQSAGPGAAPADPTAPGPDQAGADATRGSLDPVAAQRPAPRGAGDAWWIWLLATGAALAVAVAIQRRRAWLDAGPRRGR